MFAICFITWIKKILELDKKTSYMKTRLMAEKAL